MYESYVCVCVCFSDIDDCADGPCNNGGTCIDGVNSYICDCIAGYTGANCQTGIYTCMNFYINKNTSTRL